MASMQTSLLAWVLASTPSAATVPPASATARSTSTRPTLAPRRPGALLAVAASTFAAGSALSFVMPIATGCTTPHGDSPYGNFCNRETMLGLVVTSALFDAAAVTTAGFAGRGYGLRGTARMRGGSYRPRRRALAAAGIVLVVVGGAAALGSTVMPMLVGTTDPYDYPMIGLRQSSVLVGAAGGFLLGYALALPRVGVVVRPSISATQVGLAIAWR